MDYIDLAEKYAKRHAVEGSKEDALWVIALAILALAKHFITKKVGE